MSWSIIGMDASDARAELMTQEEVAEAFGVELVERGDHCLVLTWGSAVCILDGTPSDFVVLAGRMISACSAP